MLSLSAKWLPLKQSFFYNQLIVVVSITYDDLRMFVGQSNDGIDVSFMTLSSQDDTSPSYGKADSFPSQRDGFSLDSN
jgi:hypothetical protein